MEEGEEGIRIEERKSVYENINGVLGRGVSFKTSTFPLVPMRILYGNKQLGGTAVKLRKVPANGRIHTQQGEETAAEDRGLNAGGSAPSRLDLIQLNTDLISPAVEKSSLSCQPGGRVESGEKTPPPARGGRFSVLPPKWLQLLIVETFYSAEEAVL
ncbi:hypothetical protein KUCAC02_035789 [Chaenocephalus aceratus]|nr:hypothetical protein KUCAC02_035789 [Chaenocephalus aceratus]